MAFGSSRSSAGLEDILSRVTEFEILSFYLNINHLPSVINSPLRVDRNASLAIYTRDGETIWFCDFGTGKKGTLIHLLSAIWNISYTDAIQRIYNDIPKFASMTPEVREHVRKVNKQRRIHSEDSKLECKVREWRNKDLEYWESYGISLPWLKFGDVYPISHVIVTKESNRYVIPADEYAYAYVERKDGKITLKIYQPFSEKYKWSNNHDSSVWDLWTQLPKEGEDLIITSSRKDALCVWENTGIPTCSLQAESYIPKEHVVNELKSRFKNIYVLYDNDFKSKENYGRFLGKQFADKFELNQIEIPDEFEAKDSSDLAKAHGREIVKKVILGLINKE